MIAQAEGKIFRVRIGDARLHVQAVSCKAIGNLKPIIGRPKFQCFRGIGRTKEFPREPPGMVRGSVSDNAPGLSTDKTMNRVFPGRIVERKLILFAVPGKTTVANAIGKREKDGKTAARRLALLKEFGRRKQQLTLRHAPL